MTQQVVQSGYTRSRGPFTMTQCLITAIPKQIKIVFTLEHSTKPTLLYDTLKFSLKSGNKISSSENRIIKNFSGRFLISRSRSNARLSHIKYGMAVLSFCEVIFVKTIVMNAKETFLAQKGCLLRCIYHCTYIDVGTAGHWGMRPPRFFII